MSHSDTTVLAIVLFVIGLIGLLKGMKDKKDSKKVSCPAKELAMRDNQYIFMSSVVLLGGLGLFVLCRNHSSRY